MRPRRVVLALVAVVAVLAAAAYGWSVYDSRRSDPHHVALPERADAETSSKTAAFFRREGARLLEFRRATAGKLPGSPGECGDFVRRLQAVAEPRALGDLATRVPDVAVRDAAVSHLRATVAVVGACDSPTFDEARGEAEFTGIVLDRLLRRDGVPA